jgi:nucleotide-binding universal stress UspA family protein
MFQQILVLWDGSDLSERAFAIAHDLGGVYGAELMAVCVVERPRSDRRSLKRSHHDQARPAGAPLPSAAPVHELFMQRHQFSTDDQPEPFRVEFRAIHGDDVVTDLLNLAHEHGSDLVVVGHHHEHPSQHMFPRGLTERLLFSAQLPVLVVGG